MKRYRKNKRLADYQRPDDEEVYEAVTLKRDIPGQEDNDVDNDGDQDMTDAQLRYRRHAQTKLHKIDEIFVIPEEILATEKNAFHTAAANAHAAGRKHFAFGGKKYPVTMTKSAAKTFAGKGMNEKVSEPYAVGMAQAMKSTGDKPPLSKKTIRLAHKIAKGIEANEAVAWSHNTYDDYVAHNKAKGLQVIPKDLWHNLKKNPYQPSITRQNESMDPVGQEDDDINNDGKVNKNDKYLHNRRKAISASIRAKIKEGFGAVTAAGGDYDEEESHQRYKKSNLSRKENVTLGDGKGLKIYAGKTKESQIQEESDPYRVRDELKSQGKHREAGEHAYKHGLGRSYGQHFGMRSSKNNAEMEFHKGYDYAQARESRAARLKNEEVDLLEAEKPTYHYYVTHNKGDKNSDWTVTHSKKKPFATARDAADHIMRSGGRRGGTVHTVNAKTGNIVQARSYDGGQAGYARDPGIGDPRHVRDLREGAEQIDEISKKTLGSYIRKANDQTYDIGTEIGKRRTEPTTSANYQRQSKLLDKLAKRSSGIATATRKLAKEEVEQIDELSPNTLHSYIKKAAGNMAGNAAVAAAQASSSMKKSSPDVKRNIVNRMKGITGASGRLADKANMAEEAEQIDEISKSTLGSYATKALNRADIAARMSKSDSDEMGKIADKRLGGVKKAVDRLTGKKNAASIKSNIDKAREAARNRYTDKDDQGKAYYAAQKGISKIRESVELDEGVTDLSHSRLKFHATKNVPHGSYSKKQIEDEHKRRMRTEPEYKNAKPSLSEEVEELDELKKSTLGSYIRRAAIDTYHRGQDVEMHGSMHDKEDDYARKRRHSELMDRARRKASNRVTGIERATRQLAKEEVEQINELSPSTLHRYIKRSTGEVLTKGIQAASGKNDPETRAAARKVAYRMSGVATASRKLADKATKNEEVEQIDEAFKSGSIKLNDGSVVLLKSQDAKLLNDLINGLNPDNKKKMLKVAMTDKAGFNEILGFAREAL